MGTSKGSNNDTLIEKTLNVCVECKRDKARYWDSNLCENCFRNILTEKLNDE